MSQTRANLYKLTPEQYNICFFKGTEPPFSGIYTDFYEKGIYVCVNCEKELFSSETKFESVMGWPSFYDVIHKGNVKTETDLRYGMARIEVTCANCNAHLGHIFNDGPREKGGKHYCINSLALKFRPSLGS